jgi:hypothetical protein
MYTVPTSSSGVVRVNVDGDVWMLLPDGVHQDGRSPRLQQPSHILTRGKNTPIIIIWYGSGSDQDTGFWWPKIEKIYSCKKKCSASKTPIYLSRLHKERRSYRRTLQPSKKNISALQNMKFLNFFYFCGLFLPSRIRILIRIHWPESGSETQPVCTYQVKALGSGFFRPQKMFNMLPGPLFDHYYWNKTLQITNNVRLFGTWLGW